MADKEILDRCRSFGIDKDRLQKAMATNDNWGKMIHAFEYLTVLGAVLEAFEKEAK